MSNDHFQTSQRDVKTAIPVDTMEIPIRQLDWRRIYRKVKSIPRQNSFYLTATGICFGVGGSSLLSLIPLYSAVIQVEAWVIPTYWIIGISAVIIGFITAYFSKERNSFIKSNCLEVQHDMNDVHSMFFPGESLDRD